MNENDNKSDSIIDINDHVDNVAIFQTGDEDWVKRKMQIITKDICDEKCYLNQI